MSDVKARFKQYQNAIEESTIVSKTDINGIITFVNDEFCKILGYSRDELIGKNHNVVRHPSVQASEFKRLWDTILAKKVYKTTTKNLTKDGRAVYLNTTIIPILDLNGDIEEFLAVRHDVTEVVELNERLTLAQKELKELNLGLESRVNEQTAKLRELNENLRKIVEREVAKNEEKTKMLLVQSRLASMGEMIANIAHQWRQPLNELSLTLFKMKKAATTHGAEFKSSYDKCKDVIKNMSDTIEDFSGFFNGGRAAKNFTLSSAARESAAMVQGAFEKEKIKLNLDVKADAKIFGHKNQLEQVVINLLNNAKDALSRKSGEKIVEIRVFKEGSSGAISVSDNGGGIDREVADKIFEPYFTTKSAKQGTGIGLYMSKTIMDKFQGEIEAKNANGGAVFTLKIPCEKEKNE